MRRVTFTGMFMLAGSAIGAAIVSGNHLLAGVMGALVGLAASLIVHAFPRDHDYPGNNFWTD